LGIGHDREPADLGDVRRGHEHLAPELPGATRGGVHVEHGAVGS